MLHGGDGLSLSSNTSFMKIIAWLLGVMALLFQMTIQLSSGAMVDGLTATFHLSATRAGFLAGAYYPVYCLLQIPAGLLVDRFGAKSILVVGLTLAAWSMMFFGYAPSFAWAVFARLLAGVGLSCCFVSLMDLIGYCFKPSQFAVMLGLSETLVIACIITLEMILPDAVQVLSWQVVSRMLALGLAVLAALIALVMPELHVSEEEGALSETSIRSLLKELVQYLKNPVILGYGLLAGGLFGIVTIFEGLWAQPFYMHGWHRTIMQASQLNGVLLAGVGLGAPFLGYLGKFRRLRPWVTGGFSILVLFCFTVLVRWGSGLSAPVLQVLLFCLGVGVSSYVLSYMVGTEQAGKRHYGTVNGLINMLVVIPIPLIQPLIGFWLDSSQVRHHTEDYTFALMNFDWLLLAMFCISALLIYQGYRRAK